MMLEELVSYTAELASAVEAATGIKGAVLIVAVKREAFMAMRQSSDALTRRTTEPVRLGNGEVYHVTVPFIQINGVRFVEATEEMEKWCTGTSTG